MIPRWQGIDFPLEVSLGGLGHLPPSKHLFDEESIWAIKAALGARRPLLVRGEPGTGKSQLARATAEVLKRPLVKEVIHSRTESQDLLYRFDAVARLGQAQVLSLGGRVNPAGEADEAVASSVGLAELAESLFVQPGPLWWVFDWKGAEEQQMRARIKGSRPQVPRAEWTPEQGAVLLIDEIDKADADLPNGLLESLGNGEFHVPYLSDPVRCHAGEPPLVVITTNEERELPAAFLRRCLVLQLALPEGEHLPPFLIKRGRAHFGELCAENVYRLAAEQLATDRMVAGREGLPRPGQAEYLDLLRAVLEVSAGQGAERQIEVLRKVQRFALNKGTLTDRQG